MTEKNAVAKIETGNLADAASMPHNRYHRAAKSSAAMAIVYAAMAGRELIEWKKKAGHGRWLTWVENNCEFCDRTAERYIALYEGIKDKLANSAHVRNLMNSTRVSDLNKLLERPPSELLPEETEILLKELRQATDGNSLRQLYFDLGIVSPPKEKGGANQLHQFLREHYPDHPEYLKMSLRDLPKEIQKAWNDDFKKSGIPVSEEFNRVSYQGLWRHLMMMLRDNALKKKTYSYLDRRELEEVHGTLIDVKKEIMEALKK